MNKARSKLLSVLLTVVLVFAMSPAYASNAFAEMELFGDNYEYSWCYVDTGDFYVSGDGDLTLKDDGSRYWHYSNECIKVLFVEEGITSIADYVFADSTNLTTVYLYDTLTSIGPYAFSNCDALTDVYFDGTHEQYVSINGYENAFDESVTIHYLKPSISKHPSDYTGIVGSTAKFTVEAWGEELKYQWQTYSSGKWVNSTLPGYNTATLSVPVIQARNGYKFRCVVTDYKDNPVISNPAKLRVGTPVTLTAQPKDYTGTVGSTATFKVTAQGTGLKYQWQTYSSGTWKNSSLPGYNTATLSVPVIASRNGYKFRCVVTDTYKATATSNAATLHAVTPVTITAQPKDYTGEAGGTAVFKVTAQGTGLKYQWQTYSSGAWKNSSLPGYNTASLSVPMTKSRDGYKFRCVITDSAKNTITSNTATLHVTVPETVIISTAPDKDYYLNEGGVMKLSISVQGTGLKYQWQTNKPGTDTWANSSLTGANTPQLTVPAIKSRDGYKFRCVVTDSNNQKSISNAFILHVT